MLCVLMYVEAGDDPGGGAVTPQMPSTLFYFEKGSLFCLEVTIRLGWMVSEF